MIKVKNKKTDEVLNLTQIEFDRFFENRKTEEWEVTEPMNNIKPDLLAQFVEECAEFPDRNALNMYQTLATGTAVYPGQGTPLGLVYVALKGAGEAGEFAEHVGKAMRDDGLMRTPREIEECGCDGELTPERKALLIKELGDRLWYISAACNELGITLADAALINVQKLKDRQERGVLRGSGDER